MKKIITLFIVLFSALMVNAQPWFDIGVKAGYGTSFMYNTQIFEEQDLTHKFKGGYTYGGKFGFNFSQEHQAAIDVMQTTLKQGFIYYPEAGVETQRQFDIQSLDFLIMYRYNKQGTYFEFGPQLSQVSKVKYTDEGGDFISPVTEDKLINKSLYSLALGFGGYVFGTDNFGVTAGFRINYTLNDLATEEARSKNFPMLNSADPDPTRNLGVMFILEANYDFGYLVSPSCGNRRKLFVF